MCFSCRNEESEGYSVQVGRHPGAGAVRLLLLAGSEEHHQREGGVGPHDGGA